MTKWEFQQCQWENNPQSQFSFFPCCGSRSLAEAWPSADGIPACGAGSPATTQKLNPWFLSCSPSAQVEDLISSVLVPEKLQLVNSLWGGLHRAHQTEKKKKCFLLKFASPYNKNITPHWLMRWLRKRQELHVLGRETNQFQIASVRLCHLIKTEMVLTVYLEVS